MESGGGKTAFEEERIGRIMAQDTVSKPQNRIDRDILAQTACRELMTYGLWDTKTRAKRWIKKNILRRETTPEDLFFWTTGLLADGLWHYKQTCMVIERAAAGEKETALTDPEMSGAVQKETVFQAEQALSAYYARWMKRGCPIYYPDDLLSGETLLAAYEEYCANGRNNGLIGAHNVQACREAVEKLAAYGMNYPVDEMGSFPYRAAQKNGYIFVDLIGLMCPFLYRYGVVYDRADVMELAVKQIVNFAAYGMDGVTGLPYHGYVTDAACKYGIIGWGRAVGWLLRGMTGCMISEYGAERLRDAYIALVDAVLPYQHKDGYFSWQLHAMDGPVDTSATGMICTAIKQGIELHILEDSKYEQALQAGKNAVYRSVRDGKVYDCSGECEGFGQYPQRYGAYPWALGPALRL